MPDPIVKTAEQVLAELKAQPGIDVRRLAKGSVFIVETSVNLYEFTVLNPAHGLVEIDSADGRFVRGAVAQIVESTYDVEGKIALPFWIGKSLRMQLNFKNGILPCAVSLNARIRGDGWYYDVF